MNEATMERVPCPRCGGPIPDQEHEGQYPGALSRWDNDTEVCSACGSDEAMIQFAVRDGGRDATHTAVDPVFGARAWVRPDAAKAHQNK